MSLLDAMPGNAYYTVRLHYYDSRSKRYAYKWAPTRWLDNVSALDWSTRLGTQYGLNSETVLYQWDSSTWKRIA